jgi:hypothetical protein
MAGLYIRIEAKKRRILRINLWKVPKRAVSVWHGRLACEVCSRAQRESLEVLSVYTALKSFLLGWLSRAGAPAPHNYLCSKSTGAFTSCTRKYFASAGYFRATASYIAYATLRYDTWPAGVVRNSEM